MSNLESGGTRPPKPVWKEPPTELERATRILLAGHDPRLSEGALKPPIFTTSTFVFPSAEAGEAHFRAAYHLDGTDQEPGGLIYTRVNNPNLEMVEDRMVAAVPGAAAAAVFPSGMSAISSSLLAFCLPHDVILHSRPIYGGTYFLFQQILSKLQIKAVSVDGQNLTAVREALAKYGKSVRFVYLETPANPTLAVVDVEVIGQLVKEENKQRARIRGCRSVLLAVDDTVMGPIFTKPLLTGADLVFYSATKFIGGHSDLTAGLVAARDQALIRPIKDYRTILGGTTGPFTSWQLLRSLETLELRMRFQARQALILINWLERHPQVERVLAVENSALFSFEIKGGREAAFRFLNNVRLARLAVSLGSTQTLVEHPRRMTHSDMTAEDLDLCGITDQMIRVSVGLEDSQDLIADFDQALVQI